MVMDPFGQERDFRRNGIWKDGSPFCVDIWAIFVKLHSNIPTDRVKCGV
jgi:hypothetical protein